MGTRYIYIASDTDRWDNLAYDFFGDAAKVKPLMDANPDIPPTQMFLTAGQRIVVPVLPVSEATETQETTVKAPWK